ncbi:MAG TPA: hypothetical protein VFT49_04395 [Candidatus Saccharimonadales bacterium]|nr:hypothetical protein [Candidatus Saccharimonadales bacterium]
MDEPKVFDISKPKPSAGTRPVITPVPTPDPMVKTKTPAPAKVVSNDEPAGESIKVNVTPPAPATIPSSPVSVDPVPEPVPPAEPIVPTTPEPEITDIPVSQAPAPTPAAQASVQHIEAPSTVSPSLPGVNGTSFDNIPKFGELQPKIDAHPLFSGSKDHRVKVRRTPRFAWPLATLLVLIVVGYLAVDAGVVRGYSHLPFHFFKEKQVADTPAITPPATTASASQTQASTDPYADWLSYHSTAFGYSFKFPKEFVSFTAQKTADANITSTFVSTSPSSAVDGAQGPITLTDYKTATVAIATYKNGPSIALQNGNWIVTTANSLDPNKYKVGDTFKDISSVTNNQQAVYTFQTKDESSLSYNIVFVAKNSLHEISLPGFVTSSSTDQSTYDAMYRQLRDSLELTP